METAGHIPSGNPSHCKLGYLLQTTKPQQHTSDGIFGDELTFTYTHQNKEGEKKISACFAATVRFGKNSGTVQKHRMQIYQHLNATPRVPLQGKLQDILDTQG